MAIMMAIKQGLNIAKNAVVKNGPKIAMAVGTIAAVTGTIDACRQTLKAKALLEEHNSKMDDIHRAIELASAEEIEYSDIDRRKDTMVAYTDTALNFAKLYWRPVLLIGGGFASIYAGFGVLNARHVAALGAFTTVSDQFNSYRGNVIEKYGQEEDRKLLVGESEKTKAVLPVSKVSENGTEVTEDVETEAISLDEVTNDTFTLRFNWKCARWDNNYLYNENFIQRQIDKYQREFDTGRMDHLFVGDIYRSLGFYDQTKSKKLIDPEDKKKLSYGPFYGWLNDEVGKRISVEWSPYVEYFSADEADDQFPMIIPINVQNDDEWNFFRDQYIADDHKVGYLIKFNVDTDQNGIPRSIFEDVYGK